MEPYQPHDPHGQAKPYRAKSTQPLDPDLHPDLYRQYNPDQPPVPFAAPPYLPKPDKVQAIAIMSLVDGIVNVIYGIVLISTFCLAPLGLYAIAVAVLGILYASKLMVQRPEPIQPNKTLAIMQIVNILSGNVISLVIGILSLVFYDDPEVRRYYAALNGQRL